MRHLRKEVGRAPDEAVECQMFALQCADRDELSFK